MIVAISRRRLEAGSSPVISQSIHTRCFLLFVALAMRGGILSWCYASTRPKRARLLLRSAKQVIIDFNRDAHGARIPAHDHRIPTSRARQGPGKARLDARAAHLAERQTVFVDRCVRRRAA